ncbi:ribonuclease H-like domain-containing protein [Mycena rebaudengoi]|nr:ribonuclease H-like domain-containing protein [Mycena rebaudengoi]
MKLALTVMAQRTMLPTIVAQPTTRYSWNNGHTVRHYITDAEAADKLLENFGGPCGLDIEWKPSFRKGEPEHPVALLQLANPTTILLLHLVHMEYFPKNLQAFLENPDIVKAGVGIQGDAKKLYKDCLVNIRNCVDLSLLAKSVDNARWKGKYSEPIGLARLIAAYEDRQLTKGKITRSNWENKFLDAEQQESTTGHAGFTLYTRLSEMLATMSKIPSITCYTFDAIRGRLCEDSGMSWSPFNPDYDPGPPPAPKLVPGTTSGSTSLQHGNSGQLKRPLTRDVSTSVEPSPSSSSPSTDNKVEPEDSSHKTKRRRRRPAPRPRNGPP